MVAQKPALLVILFSLHVREMGALTLIKLSYFFYRYLRDRYLQGSVLVRGGRRTGRPRCLDSGVEREEERTSSPSWGEVGTWLRI